jgi:aminoglycoside phosphotransferase (APT) family kinase protein
MEPEIHNAEASGQSIVGDPVDAILTAYQVPGPWQPLEATGIANRIYATHDVVLRVATDHHDAIVDALTESIAAPAAREAGILTPRLIAFDNSRKLVDRPFSLWERVHGQTLGLLSVPSKIREHIWREVGQQIARLHDQVKSCPDPNGYLDKPQREMTLGLLLGRFAASGHAGADLVREIEQLMLDLTPFVSPDSGSSRFLHNDLHESNIMCSSQGELLALIDRGDAGWGDPTLDFAAIPFAFIPAALEGYGPTERLGDYPEALIIWDHLQNAVDDAIEDRQCGVPIAEYCRFLDRTRTTPNSAFGVLKCTAGRLSVSRTRHRQ